jgi:hypothetical protein
VPSLKISVAAAGGTHFSEASKPSQYSAVGCDSRKIGSAAPTRGCLILTSYDDCYDGEFLLNQVGHTSADTNEVALR